MSNILEKAYLEPEFDGVLNDFNTEIAEDLSYLNSATVNVMRNSKALYDALQYYRTIEVGDIPSGDIYGYSATEGGKYLLAEITVRDNPVQRTTKHCAITKSGTVYAAVSIEGGKSCAYVLGPKVSGGNNGEILIFAILQFALGDAEARTAYQDIGDILDKLRRSIAITADEKQLLSKRLSLLTQNIYFRYVSENSSEKWRLKKPSSNKGGEFHKLNFGQINNGAYKPQDTVGNFLYFKTLSNNAATTTNGVAYSFADFRQEFALKRSWSKQEKEMIPVLNPKWVLDERCRQFATYMQKGKDMADPLINYMLSGISGTGKTTTCDIIAYGRQQPKATFTCSANTEFYNFTCDFVPVDDKDAGVDSFSLYDANNELDIRKLCEVLGLPQIEDIHYDLNSAYAMITGSSEVPKEVSSDDVIELLLSRLLKEVSRVSGGHSKEQKYRLQPAVPILAIKNGWLLEIQEPKVIRDQGVLVGLNSLFERDGVLTLPNGEVVRRHPDSIIILTTNDDYFGCDNLNQSVISRVHIKEEVSLPDIEIMARRAMSNTGYMDLELAKKMAKVVNDAQSYCAKNGITDGVCDQRALNAWMATICIDGMSRAYENCIKTVINKASDDKEDRKALEDGILKPSIFATL